MKSRITLLAFVVGISVIGSASAYQELEKIKTELAAGSVPTLPEPGSKLVRLHNGEEMTRTYTAKDEKPWRWKSAMGANLQILFSQTA